METREKLSKLFKGESEKKEVKTKAKEEIELQESTKEIYEVEGRRS